MTIIHNRAKCDHCGDVIESRHRHDFVTHWCTVAPSPDMEWKGNNLVPNGKLTWLFAVDGGKAYLKRCGSGYTDTSECTEDV